ncbi:ABC transporter ATP-binding protein [Actinopolymorpha pittospori]|uniref:ATP-binding cassette subfamily B protein n=1 Tax=Actinopolymorpha pittospori TaxID=648752 RepID=A0A927N2M9_9ACTN|nr:ABC transporter ATP-binding protein [Actinopolymorpha pittospori]MBE1609833.1 ATP-binding cassette subfamily B protein [Actinopolymorpha pittospori]
MSDRPPVVSRLRATGVLLQIAWNTDRPRTVAAFVLLGSEAVTAALFAWWLKLLLDALTPINTAQIVAATCGMAAAIAVAAALNYTGQRVQIALRDRTLAQVDERLVRLVGATPTLEIHETPEYLDQLHALNRESWHLGHAIPGLLNMFATGIRIIIAAILLAGVSPLLLLLPLFAIPTLALSSKTGALFELGNDRAAAPARLAHHLYELATNPAPAKEVRLFRLADELTARFHRTEVEIQRIHRRVNLTGQALTLLGRVIFMVGYFAAIAYVVTLAVQGRASIGDAGLTAVLAGQVLTLVTGSADLIQLAFRSLATVARFVYLTDFARQHTLDVDARTTPPRRLDDGIELEHVSYRYPASDHDALHDVSLRLPAGATVAIVGDNGAGKSTLVKLLAGLYPPSSGRVTIDGTDLTHLNPDQWRRHISAAFQDHARFEFLLLETVGIGDLATRDDPVAVRAALDRAGAADLPAGLPAGIDTQLGPNWPAGIDLSGGQWQKLALGRAMMRTQPLLLLLDEPTAAIDADTEHQLFQQWTAAAAKLRHAVGAITILVSHRFSTVRMADHIVVLNSDGTIAETGSHTELLQRHGTYAELFELQARTYR